MTGATATARGGISGDLADFAFDAANIGFANAWLVPYTGYWVWVVAVSVVLLRRGARERQASQVE
ncbi:hypothetical protein GCM10027053_41370 [Intrasporangium mesophilum]